ncbi:MAG: ABC transporter ATP-binding protein [Candidatus Omnitrophota bacterium]
MNEIIRVTNLDVGYENETVLEGLNFTITKGEITVILGKSGCGKTTIIKTIIGLIPPLTGDVFFAGNRIDYASERMLKDFYKKIGVLYQNGALLNSLNLYENTALPLRMHFPTLPKKIEEEMVYYRLSQVGLRESAQKFPSELSTGMRKRAALARAMILDPEIIFCDEPTAGLDPITAAGLDTLMLDLKHQFGMTLLVVTHELRSIEKIADKAMVLNNKRLLYFGEYQALKTINDSFINSFFLKDTHHDH